MTNNKTNSMSVKLLSGIKIREQRVTLRHVKHREHEAACVLNKDKKGVEQTGSYLPMRMSRTLIKFNV